MSIIYIIYIICYIIELLIFINSSLNIKDKEHKEIYMGIIAFITMNFIMLFYLLTFNKF